MEDPSYLFPLPAASANALYPSRGQVLIADDDVDIRCLLERGLRSAGFCAQSAADGEQAWDALCADDFDALITDHDMPRLTGLDLIRRVRSVPLPMPVVLMSGRMPAVKSDLARLLAPGVAVTKPFSFVDLLTKLRGILAPQQVRVPIASRLTL
jgi:DNA-binding response OmpR family regulator